MEPILFLCHRIPFPPNKGDKIRSFNILKYLSQKYEVHLGTFVDDPNDWQYEKELSTYCKSVQLLPLTKKRATLKGLTSFLTGKPITLPYYHNWEMSAWVKQIVDMNSNLEKAFIFSSAVAQYLEDPEYDHINKVIDFVDVDSDKWRQYADGKKGIMRWVYKREYKKLEAYEKKICQLFNASLFVSPQEAEHFKSLVDISLHNKVGYVLNGVDTQYFSIDNKDIEPLDINKPSICFTGAMDYWANVDAVVWFKDEVWPVIKQQIPELEFYIVGGNPTEAVKNLANGKDIFVTGRVKDVIPYVNASFAAIAPMRIARGIQNKVLEAMALSKPIVMTPMAAEGINLPASQLELIQTEPKQFAAKIALLYQDDQLSKKIGQDNLDTIRLKYEWDAVLAPLDKTL